jgi:hypothetical protein
VAARTFWPFVILLKKHPLVVSSPVQSVTDDMRSQFEVRSSTVNGSFMIPQPTNTPFRGHHGVAHFSE